MGAVVSERAVVVAGGGPTGMMLGAELALAGVDVVIIERRVTQEVDGSRAGGLHARTLEVFDQRGIADRFMAEGTVMQTNGFAYNPLDISDFPTRFNHGLALLQRDIERIMAGWIAELGVPTIRGVEVVGLMQGADGVDVAISDGSTIRSQYLVGCDGGRSVVRKAAGIEFPGLDPSTSWMIAEAEMDDDPPQGFTRNHLGQHAIGRPPGGPVRAVLTEASVEHDHEPTLDEFRAALVDIYGTDFGLRSVSWISRFTDMSRQADPYRHGRVLVAGDAAHIHPPQGGQGLGTGVQDAVNLGWKLAQVVKGTSPETLLDTYQAERHPVGARVLHNTQAQVALASADDRHQALRETVAQLLSLDEARKAFGGMMSGLDIHYDLGVGHPLLGRRMPDLDLTVGDRVVRVFELLHAARPVLVDFGTSDAIDIEGWSDRVRLVAATYDGTWELPVIGAVEAPSAVLVRPDGHVAWVGTGSTDGLEDALLTWFGPPTA